MLWSLQHAPHRGVCVPVPVVEKAEVMTLWPGAGPSECWCGLRNFCLVDPEVSVVFTIYPFISCQGELGAQVVHR